MSSWFYGQVSSLVRTALIFFIILFLLPAFSIAAQVTLAWDANDPAPEGYRIYQRTEGQAYNYSQPVWTGFDTTFTVDNLNDDITYYFVVQAYVEEVESGDSNEISFLSISPSATTYTISASTTDHGSISPSGTVTLEADVDQTFYILPDDGYYINDVFVDGVSIGAVPTYTFHQVATDHSISAEFAIISHTISSSTGANGSISPSGDIAVDHSSSKGFTITPASGYRLADVLLDGISVGPTSYYQFDQVIEDHTIHAIFVADTYIISAMASENGTITPSGNTNVSFGGSQTYTFTPDSGCSIIDVIIDGVSVGSTTMHTFSDVEADHTVEVLFALENIPPEADAGPDQTVDEGLLVTLSGLNSIDRDDGITTFQWRQIQGSEVALSAPESPETTFTTPNVDSAGTALVFELVVTDYSGVKSVDNCIVNVTWVNVPPTASADVDQIVSEGTQVSLNATKSTDPDDGIESYLWKQLNGLAVILSDDKSATPTFQAPNVGPEGASMTFEITVIDAGGLQDTDTSLVTVAWVNIPPVADAGPDQQINTGNEVTLDGSLSTDTDGDMGVSYRWRQTDGVPVELSDTTAQQPVFVAPDMGNEGGLLTFELTVTDSGGMMATDTCQVIINPETPSEDTIPPNLTIEDPIGDPITVSWHKISFSGTAWDDREVAQVVWKNSTGSSGIAMGTTQWFIDRIMLKRGENVITVTAYDTSGNQSTISKSLYLKR